MISARSPDEHTLRADAKRAQRQGLLRAPPKFRPEWEQEYMQAEYTPGMLLGFLGVVIPFNVLMWIVVGTIPLKMHARGGIARTRGAWRLAAVRARALCFRGVMCARSSGVVRCRAN